MSATPANISRTILLAMERAAVASWPALETAEVEGWLWRYASGGSLRANTVSALTFTGGDVEAAVTGMEQRYRAKGAPCRFTITEVSAPADLEQRLAVLGYTRSADHVTMARAVRTGAALPADVDRLAEPSPEWLAVYLSGLSPDRRAIAPTLLAGLPRPRTFLACRRGGVVLASGLTIPDWAVASVQCMATLPEARRQGCGQAVLAAIEAEAAAAGCRHLYLQTELANAAAIGLYERFGFAVAGRYHIRTRP